MKISDSRGEELDAELSVLPRPSGAKGFAVILESRGGRGRNPEYNEALFELLRRVSVAEGKIVSIEVISDPALKLPREDRSLNMHFPIQLSSDADIESLQLEIGRKQIPIAQKEGAAGGNRTKRISIEIADCDKVQSIEEAVQFLRSDNRRTWIFQWNPKVFGGNNYLDDKEPGYSADWSVNRYRNDIFDGDRMLLWRSGSESGIYAVATLKGEVFKRAKKEQVNSDSKEEWAIAFQFDEIVDPPVLRTSLLVHPALKELDVIRFPNATNFKVGAAEWDFLEKEIRERSQALADEVEASVEYPEGAVKRVFVNAYERSGPARKNCINHHGTTCAVCTFNFEEFYGSMGEGFIHVHHLLDLSLTKPGQKVDGVKDLRPVCPNCHAMLHKSRPAHSIEWLKKQIQTESD